MRKLALSALVTLGLAASSAAVAAPLSSGAAGLSTATISASLVEQAAVRCRNVRVCRMTPYGRRCHWNRVCRRVW